MSGEDRLSTEKLAELLEADCKKDLHLHTYFSDGTLSPEELIDDWADQGYELISITDHDGIAGSVAGFDYAEKRGLQYIPGIELDSHDELGRDMHILGYGIDYESDALREALDNILLERAARNEALLSAIVKLGYDISLDDVIADNDGRYIGKPTFSRVLARKGYISKPDEAFTTIFREPSVRCIRKKTMTSHEAIDLIHAAGGLAVLAHPMEQRHLDESYNEFTCRLYPIMDRMREYGIDGVECYHPSADAVQAEVLKDYAVKHGLLVTEGSDFHSYTHRRNFSRYHRP